MSDTIPGIAPAPPVPCSACNGTGEWRSERSERPNDRGVCSRCRGSKREPATAIVGTSADVPVIRTLAEAGGVLGDPAGWDPRLREAVEALLAPAPRPINSMSPMLTGKIERGSERMS